MSYTGLIVGGPLDGRTLVHGTPQWNYNKTPETPHEPIRHDDMAAMQAAHKAASEVGTYYYTDLTMLGSTGHSNGRRIGFWIEHDKTIDDAVEAVLKRYQEPRKHLDLLKRARRMMERLFRLAVRLEEHEFRETRDILNEIEETTHEG